MTWGSLGTRVLTHPHVGIFIIIYHFISSYNLINLGISVYDNIMLYIINVNGGYDGTLRSFNSLPWKLANVYSSMINPHGVS